MGEVTITIQRDDAIRAGVREVWPGHYLIANYLTLTRKLTATEPSSLLNPKIALRYQANSKILKLTLNPRPRVSLSESRNCVTMLVVIIKCLPRACHTVTCSVDNHMQMSIIDSRLCQMVPCIRLVQEGELIKFHIVHCRGDTLKTLFN